MGKQLDMLVAEKVMGWRRYDTFRDKAETMPITLWVRPDRQHPSPHPAFSTDIAAAFSVVEHMRQKYHAALISRGRIDGQSQHAPGWQAEFSPYGPSGKIYIEIADTAPLAICRAALSAMNEEQP